MKQILKKWGFRRPDEMQRLILLKAQRNGYIFLALGLLCWSLHESYGVYARQDRLNLTPSLLLVGAALIQSFSQAVLTRRAVKGDEESCETGALSALILLSCAVAGVLVAAAGALLLLGARL